MQPQGNSASYWTLVPALLVLSAGCGGNDGPQRYDLSGKVTYGGEPVPGGVIVLEPDQSKGNRGPGAVIEFTDGRYDTPSGKGTVGGPHVARIVGYTGQPAGGDASTGIRPLFSEYQVEVDLPPKDASHDFDVPAEHR